MGATSASAALLVYEGFDYTGGTSLGATTNGGTGWSGAWSVTSGSAPVVDNTQLAPVGTLSTSGLSVTQSGVATANSVTRSFSAIGTGVTSSSSQTIWLSFEMKGNNNNSNDAYLALLRNTGATPAAGGSTPDGSGVQDEMIRIGRKSGVSGGNITLSSAATTSPAQTAFGNIAFNNTTYFLLAKIDIQRSGVGTGANFYTVDLWSFTGSLPLSEGSIGSSVASFTTSVLSSGSGLDKVRLVDAASGANASFDEIRIGTTFADVVAIPEPSAFAALAGLGSLVLAASRRRSR